MEKKLLNYNNACEFNFPKPVTTEQKDFASNDELSTTANVKDCINLVVLTIYQMTDLAELTEVED